MQKGQGPWPGYTETIYLQTLVKSSTEPIPSAIEHYELQQTKIAQEK
jgi:hypothetical protein